MSKANRILLLAAAALFLLSVLTYVQSVGRGDRFQRGQLFLANLNPDEIARIQITQGGETVTLNRQSDRFVVVEKNNYPAGNAAVNRLIRDLLEIGLEREVGRGEDLERELGLEPPTDETIEIVLTGRGGKEMVRLRVGDAFEEGPGHYVQRIDGEDREVYLTSGGVFPTTSADAFLDKEIVDHERSEVSVIRGVDFTLRRVAEGGDLELEDLPAGLRLDTTEVGRLASLLSGLRYDDVFVADAPEVADLEFDRSVEIDLGDGSGYVLKLANREDRHYLEIRGRSDLQQVAIAVDESEEELKKKAEKLTRADEIDAFNSFHGSWIYEISSFTAEKLQLAREDLIASESE